MTLSEPRIGTIDFDGYSDNFWRYADIVSAVYQPGMTGAETTEAIKVWISRKLVPYLRANFQSLEISWETQVTDLTKRTTNAIADALTAIAAADIPITDPVILAVLTTADTQVRGWLDAQYAAKQSKNARNALTGWWHVDDFGAKGDNSTHDEGACQAAIDAATAYYATSGTVQRVYFGNNVYLIGNSNHNQNPSWGLMLKSGVELYGEGTLKTAPGTVWDGTDWAIVRTPDSGAANLGIRGLSFDGDKDRYATVPNAPDSTKSCNNITFGSVQGAWIIGVRSFNSVASGMMVAGHSNNLATNVRITDCEVSSCNVIGIQVSQFDGLEILNNTISWTSDNAIDIYGEPESHNAADGCKGTNFKISGNKIHDCGNGIFPETVGKGLISNNHINNVTDAGVHVNRINAQPDNIIITDNYVFGCQSGVIVTGDTGGVTIRNNLFEWYNKAALTLGGNAQTNVSNVYFLGNTANGNSDNTPMILCAGANHLVNIVAYGNMTRSRNRSLDFVNYCTNNVNLTMRAATSPGDAV